jgi:hypothetical protein
LLNKKIKNLKLQSLASVWNIARRGFSIYQNFKKRTFLDVEIPKSAPKSLLLEKHVEFVLGYGRDRESYVRARNVCFILVA